MPAYFTELLFGLGLGAVAAGLGYAFIPWNGRLRQFIRKHALLILWVAFVVFTLLFWAKGATRYWALGGSLMDEGVFTSQLWNTLRGRLNGTGIYQGSYYLMHFAPSLSLLAIFYAPWQNPVWLYGLRALGATGGALGFYYLVRELGLSRSSGLLFAFIWLGNIAVHGGFSCDFHEVTFVGGFFTWVVLLALRRQYVWCLLLALVLVGFKEDIPVYIGGLGLIVALSFRRPLAGWLLVALAVGYYIAVTSFIWNLLIPAHIDYFSNKFPQFHSATTSSLTMVLANPLGLITPVLGWDRIWGLIVFFMPVLFLPFMRWGWLGLILPLWLMLGMEGYNDLFFAGYYGVPIVALITICAIPGYQMMREKKNEIPKYLFWAMVGLTFGSNFTQNPEVNYSQFDIYGMLPHPYLNTIEKIAAETSPNLSLNADVYIGSHFVNRKTIRVFPDNDNWLSDCLYLSNRMLDNPLVLLSIGEFGYGELISHPGFFILGRGVGSNAGEDYMARLHWMEAEATGWPLWTIVRDHHASGNFAEFIPSHAAYGDRSRLTPRLLLPPGDYKYRVPIATSDNPKKPFCFVFEVSFIKHDESREVLTNTVAPSTQWGKMSRYESIEVPFTVKEWGLTYLNINFGTEPDVWWDGVGLEGLPQTFGEYFRQIFPQTFGAESGNLTNSPLLEVEGMAGKVLKIDRDDCGKVVCRWQVDPNLPEDDYWIYYQNDSYGKKPLVTSWGTMEKLNNANDPNTREILGPLYVCRREPDEDTRVERFGKLVHLVPGSYLQIRVDDYLDGEIVLGKLWICNNVIIENVMFYVQ